MKTTATLGLALLATLAAWPQAGKAPRPQRKVIDVHLHALPANFFGPPGLPNPKTGAPSAATTDEAIMRATLAALEKYNVVKAVASGPLGVVAKWRAAAPERIVPSPSLFVGPGPGPTPFELRTLHRDGAIGAIGEVGAQYAGLTLADPPVEAYLSLADELGLPLLLHTGFGPPAAPYTGTPKYRAALGNPLLTEDALVRHPNARVSLMHAGFPFLEETIAVLHAHPQVYADLAVINWALDRREFHEYLRRLMLHSGHGCDIPKRLMFGSDQMIWPEAVGMAIEGIESAPFLTTQQKQDVLCNNAARFLRLDPAVCR